jgi:hypothetical protein
MPFNNKDGFEEFWFDFDVYKKKLYEYCEPMAVERVAKVVCC